MYEELAKEWNKSKNFPVSELTHLVNAIMQAYPMIVIANLSKNQYTMLRDEGFLCKDVLTSGNYDDMIDENVENIHPNYQQVFLESFDRQNLIKKFASGAKEVYAELYQKNRAGIYHWVSTHVIRIEDEDGDIMQICLNRVLDGKVERMVSRK